MAAFKFKLAIDQGSTFTKLFTWKAGTPAAPVDLTGCTARMQLRSQITSDAILIELTTENGRITLGGTAGTIELTISATDTAALNFTSAVYDLEIVYADGTVRRLISGTATLSPEVTR